MCSVIGHQASGNPGVFRDKPFLLKKGSVGHLSETWLNSIHPAKRQWRLCLYSHRRNYDRGNEYYPYHLHKDKVSLKM